MMENFISQNNVTISAGLLIISYIFIALDKIPKVTVALLGAGITIIIGLVSQHKMVGDALNPNYFINFVDFNVMISLFICSIYIFLVFLS